MKNQILSMIYEVPFLPQCYQKISKSKTYFKKNSVLNSTEILDFGAFKQFNMDIGKNGIF